MERHHLLNASYSPELLGGKPAAFPIGRKIMQAVHESEAHIYSDPVAQLAHELEVKMSRWLILRTGSTTYSIRNEGTRLIVQAEHPGDPSPIPLVVVDLVSYP